VPPKRPPRSDGGGDGPDAIARASATAMLARDTASRGLGIELVEAGPGRATVRMTVRDDMVNGLDVCHGGLIFALADTAMAVASNSYDEMSFAAAATIDFLRPAPRGTMLTALATERHRLRRTGIYDVEVTCGGDDGTGELVATFRGRTHTVGGSVVRAAGDE
jgi:acyl-CoA thioesterase